MPLLLALLLLAADTARPTVAVVPPFPEGGADSWIGASIADNITARLLFHSQLDPRTMQRQYPLNVFGWRQTQSAARANGIDTTTPLFLAQAPRLARELGADVIFVGSYKVDGTNVTLSWQLAGDPNAKIQALVTDLDKLPEATEALAGGVLRALGQDAGRLGGHSLKSVPLAGMRPYGQALEILAGQTLAPHAPRVLPQAKLEEAHRLLAVATDAAPEFARGWVEQGIASTLLGNYPQAEDELLHAMAAAGEFEPANSLGLFVLYEHQNNEVEAIKIIAEATTTHLGFLQGLGYLGEAHLRMGDAHEALQAFTAYRDRVPKSPWARMMRATALGRLGKHDQAVADMTQLVSEFPDSVPLVGALADRLLAAASFDAARLILAQGLQAHPTHPTLLTRLAALELLQNHPNEAAAAAREAVTALGQGRGEAVAATAHFQLGYANALLGQTQEAYAALAKARDLGVDATERQTFLHDDRLKDFIANPACPIR